MKRLIFIFITFLSMLATAQIRADELPYIVDSNATDGQIGFAVERVDFRDDLTRVYGSLIGMPHTSDRIDTLTAIVDGRSYESTDIDGVDMRRWFQWEDSVQIPVEIDFPPIPSGSTIKIMLTGPKGSSTWTIKRRP